MAKVSAALEQFLSTPSARRATGDSATVNTRLVFLSTPSARRATHQSYTIGSRSLTFLSTPSARRATFLLLGVPGNGFISIHALREEGDALMAAEANILRISIHALREEGDRCSLGCGSARYYFYPRPPRGGRPSSGLSGVQAGRFLSTPSARRATAASRRPTPTMAISIHALREEGDQQPKRSAAEDYNISIHALREEGDLAR